MQSLAVALIGLVALVAAQDNSSVIPSTISVSCSSYLTSLNSDSTLSACTAPLLAASSSFSPSSTTSNSTLSATLDDLCATPACPDTLIRTQLAQFYAACSSELTASGSATPSAANEEVRQFYDVLYVVNPLRTVVCSKDNTTSAWCVEEIAHDNKAAATSSSSNSTLAAKSLSASSILSANLALAKSFLSYLPSLSRRQDTTNTTSPLATPTPLANDTSLLPNTTTYGSTNLAFLFLLPSLPSSLLCTSCTRTVLTTYVAWESTMPYALGLANSPILGGQAALWQGVGEACGTSFLDGVEQGAGAVPMGGSLSGAGRAYGEVAKWVLGVVAGVVAAGVAL